MARRFGIAGRLFLAFAGIAGLSLAAGGVGWWTLSNIQEAQRTVAERALPAVADARAVAALSARLIARGPLLANAAGQAQRRAVAEDLFAQVERLDGLLDRIASYAAPDGGEATARVAALRAVAGDLLANLRELDSLATRRIDLTERVAETSRNALAAADGLSDLSETLISNAAASTTAVISNLYELVETEGRSEEALQALDRLVEVDVFMLERMFELRLRASQVGLLLNQLSRTETAEEVDRIAAVIGVNLQILERRVAGIPDPVRRDQAAALFDRLIAIRGDESGGESASLFARRAEILAVAASIDALTEQNRALSESLNGFVVGLVDESKALADRAALEVDRGGRGRLDHPGPAVAAVSRCRRIDHLALCPAQRDPPPTGFGRRHAAARRGQPPGRGADPRNR